MNLIESVKKATAMKSAKKKFASTQSKKPRAKKTIPSADTRWQTCSICKTIPERSRAFWKGGEQQENNLPPSMDLFKIVGEPLYDTSTSYSNNCLMQCPECQTYYDWDFEYEFLIGGSEDEINMTRLSHAEGEKRARAILKDVEAHKAQFAEQAPQHVDALRHAPREPERLKAAADFFFREAYTGGDLAVALPEILRALSRMESEQDVASSLRTVLFAYGRQNWQSLQTLLKHLRDTGMDRAPVLASVPADCEKALRANCRICRNLPDAVTVLLETQDLPPASNQLVQLGLHFHQCPICGTYYFRYWDTFPFVSGASDEQWLCRFSPDEADLLQPFWEVLPNHAEDMAFYVDEVFDRMPLALLCAFDDRDKSVRALAYRCLTRFVAGQPDHARQVLDFCRQHEQSPPTPRTRINTDSLELQKIIRECEQVLNCEPPASQ